MVETEAVAPNAPFLQGDIIKLVSDGGSPDPAYGLIINADCDLAHCRIDGVVSYLPVYPFARYFEKFWIPSYVDTRRIELLSSIQQTCGIAEDAYDGLRIWVKEEDDAEAIIRRLSETFSVKPSSISARIYELALIERSGYFDRALLDKIIEVQGTSKKEALSKLARRALKSLGDGQFFINEIFGLEEIGFVVRMRRIYGIGAEDVYPSLSKVTIAEGKLRAARIAKLSNLYRFKIAQLFAYQFSRIGLPDENTELNQVAVEAAIYSMGESND